MINADDPQSGKPSDHLVPVCTPHTDRHKPPALNYRIIKYRILPQSKVRKFGEWITSEDWDCVVQNEDPTEQVKHFERILSEKLNLFCPENL